MDPTHMMIINILSRYDICVSRDVLTEIVNMVEGVDVAVIDQVIVSLVEIIRKEHDTTIPLTLDIFNKITHSCTQDSTFSIEDCDTISVVNYNQFPQVIIMKSVKSNESDIVLKYHTEIATKNNLKNSFIKLGSIDDTTSVFSFRYRILMKNLHKFLQDSPKATQGAIIQSNVYTINQIKFNQTKQSSILLLGMFTESRNKSGVYLAEDIDGSIELDLTHCETLSEFIVLDTFVLLEGIYQNGIFNVLAIGNPPEHSFTVEDFTLLPIQANKSNTLNQTVIDHISLAIFSDIWLDNIEVFENLKEDLLKLCSSGTNTQLINSPEIIIICGCFTSPSCCKKLSETSNGFKLLIEFLTENSNFKEKTIVFVPSLDDPSLYSMMPRPPLPKSVINHSNDILLNHPNIIFGTNPCKIKIGKHSISEYLALMEIAVVRCDILEKACSNAYHIPNSLKDIPLEFSKFFMSQCHLLPLPPNAFPIVWPYDSHLFLYPKPDIIICSSNYPKFIVKPSEKILFINPGSYSINRNNYFFENIYINNNHI